MNQNGSPWTEERTATAKRLWIEGYSANQIAKRLGGISRNAVIGKINRAGLQRSAGALRATCAPSSTRAAAARRAAAPRKATFASEPPTPSIIRAPTPIREDEPSRTRVALVDLNASMCRWPIGDPATPDFHFCGGKRLEPGSYCAGHALKAYQPTSSAKELARSLRRYSAR